MGTAHQIQNTLQVAVTPESFAPDAANEFSLARTIIGALMAGPKPQPDEFGLSAFRELWVQFTPEGSEVPPIPSELDSDEFHNTWLNAMSLIRPSEAFLQDFQQSLQQTLRWLFESTEHFPQQETILLRIVAS